MPEFDLIDRYADDPALRKETDFILSLFDEVEAKAIEVSKSLKTSFTVFDNKNSGIKSMIDQLKALESQVGNYPKILSAASKLAQIELTEQKKKVQELVEVQKKQSILLKEEEAQQKRNNQAKREATEFEKALAKEMANKNSQAAAEAKLMAMLTDEYALLNKSLKDAELRYKNLALTIGFEADATKEALNEALAIRGVLDKLDGNLRNYQRNVGNYKSAFNGLGFSFTQVARELPSLAINAQTFFLAISNNLPMVFDEVSKAKKEIADMRAEGLKTPGMFERISKSILSFNVLMGIGIALITTFSGQIIDGIKKLFGYDDALEKAAEAADRLVKAQLRLIQASKDVNALVFEDITDLDRMDKELKMAQALGKSRGDLLAIEKKIIDAKALAANKLFIESEGWKTLKERQVEFLGASLKLNELIRMQAKATTEDARASWDKDIERAQNRFDLAKVLVEEQKKIVRDNFEFTTQMRMKEIEIDRYNAEQKLLIQVEYAKISAETIIARNTRILNDERSFEQARIAALRSSAAQRKRIIDAELRKTTENPANKNENGTFTAEAKTAIRKANADRVQVEKELQVAIFNVQEEFRKRRLAAEKSARDSEREELMAAATEISESVAQTLDARLKAYDKYVDEQHAQILADFEYQIATQVMTDDEILALQVQFFNKLNALTRKSRKELAEIVVSSLMQEVAVTESVNNKLLAAEEAAAVRSTTSKEERDKKLRKLQYEYKRNDILNQIEADKAILESDKTTKEQKEKAQVDLNNQMAALYRLDTANYIAEQDEKLKALNNFLEKGGAIANQVFDIINGAINAQVTRQKNAIEEQIKDIERVRDAELAANDARVQSDQDRAANAILINQRAQNQKEALQRRQAELDRKRAQAEKAQAIFNIILSTTQAVIKAYTEGDPYTKVARAVLAGVIGAAQLAVAIATPIPQFKDGLFEDYEGPGIINDHPSGRKEALVHADGSISFPQGRNVLRHFKKGERVLPDADVVRNNIQRAAMKDITRLANGTAGEDNYGYLMAASIEKNIANMGDKVVAAINNKESLSLSASQGGMEAMWRHLAGNVKYVNQNTNWGG